GEFDWVDVANIGGHLGRSGRCLATHRDRDLIGTGALTRSVTHAVSGLIEGHRTHQSFHVISVHRDDRRDALGPDVAGATCGWRNEISRVTIARWRDEGLRHRRHPTDDPNVQTV